MSKSSLLGDLVKEARQHATETRQRERAERIARQWQPTALVLVETAVTCQSCGHTDYCGSGVLVRYERNRPNAPIEVHETDTPFRLDAFSDLPRQVRHRSTTTRACRKCFTTGSIDKMLPYVDKLRLQHDGNTDADELDINEENIDTEAQED